MGISRAGSKPFSMASQIRTAPTTYMTICWGVMASRLIHKKFKLNVFSSLSSLCFDLPHAGPGPALSWGGRPDFILPYCPPDNQKAHKKTCVPRVEHRSGHFRQNQKEAASFRIVGSAAQRELCRLLPLTATILSQPQPLCQAVRLRILYFLNKGPFLPKRRENHV